MIPKLILIPSIIINYLKLLLGTCYRFVNTFRFAISKQKNTFYLILGYFFVFSFFTNFIIGCLVLIFLLFLIFHLDNKIFGYLTLTLLVIFIIEILLGLTNYSADIAFYTFVFFFITIVLQLAENNRLNEKETILPDNK